MPGFAEDLTRKLLGAQAHVDCASRDRHAAFADYSQLTNRCEQDPRSRSGGAGSVSNGPDYQRQTSNKGVVMKGIIPERESRMSALSETIVAGQPEGFQRRLHYHLGQELANTLGTFMGDHVADPQSAEAHISPLGELSVAREFRVVAIFSSGLYDHRRQLGLRSACARPNACSGFGDLARHDRGESQRHLRCACDRPADRAAAGSWSGLSRIG